MSALPTPLNLKAWIDEHRHLLKPPVGNKVVWEDRDFMVTVAGGPSQRKDFHVNPTEELFFQVEGDFLLRVVDAHEQVHELPIREGELFLLPPNVPHSPQRAGGTVGLVVERRRPKGEDDHIRFYCEKCGEVVHDEQFELADVNSQFKRMMEEFWSDATMRTCMHCGTVVQPPSGQVVPPPKDMAAPVVRISSGSKKVQPSTRSAHPGASASALRARTSAAPARRSPLASGKKKVAVRGR